MEEQSIVLAVAAMNAVHDKAKNLEKYDELVTEAAARGARLLILPEQTLQGYLYHLNHTVSVDEANYHYDNAEPVPGPSTERVIELARQAGMHIVFGMTERVALSSSGILYNSAVLVGPAGLIGVYRKVHAPGDEYHIFRQGRDWPVFDIEFARVGIHICYDLRFPEAARELALRGAQILILPTAWPKPAGALYDVFDRARAAENECWYLSADQVGTCDQGELTYYGHSRIIDPYGNVIADTGEEEGIAVAEVPLGQLRRRQWGTLNVFRDRRPETYNLTASEEAYHRSGDGAAPPPEPARTEAEHAVE